MKTIKIEIKSIFGTVLFAYECEDNTIKKTVEEAVKSNAKLRYANLRYADLRYAELSNAKLRFADLRFADLRYAELSNTDLRYAKLRYADLSYAKLSSIKNDYWVVLLNALSEIPNLKKSIIEGKIDGSTYEGECACLCGTVMKSESPELVTRINAIKSPSRLIEVFFAAIKKGDTPETNQVSAIVLDWLDEFIELMRIQGFEINK